MDVEKIIPGKKLPTLKPKHSTTGFGKLLDDFPEQAIDINDLLIRNKQATYYMEVNCNSMINAGIEKGNIVVVDRSQKPENGKIVIAIVDGEMLIRRYQRTFNKLYLSPETHKLSRIEISEFCGCAIWGVVVWVLSKV